MSVTKGDYAALGSTSGKTSRPSRGIGRTGSLQRRRFYRIRYAKTVQSITSLLRISACTGMFNEGCSGMRFTHMNLDGGAGGFRLTGGAAAVIRHETYKLTIADCTI